MTQYRKKPVIIEAWQWTGEKGDLNRAPQWLINAYTLKWGMKGSVRIVVDVQDGFGVLQVMTLEGIHDANPGDWMIQGVKGEIYPCKPDIFDLTYERIQNE